MASTGEFFNNPLVTWVNTFRHGSPVETITEFVDGVFLNEVMVDIDPTYFTLTRVHTNVDGDVNIKIQNLDTLVRHLKAYYQEKLQQLVLLRAPDVVTIAHDPESDVSLQELIRILLLMLGCAVQCEKKEDFIEKIKELDFEVQKNLVECIKEITEKSSNVLTFRIHELAEASLESVVEFVESTFYQMCHLIDERDDLAGMVTHLTLEKENLLQEKQNLKSQRPFSPPLSVIEQPTKDSPSLSVTKEKLRLLTEEVEEKNVAIGDLKDELVAGKKIIERLRQENKDLSQDARWVKAYRDEMDMLKAKADKVEKLETEVSKYRDKLRDLDYLKKRAEELKEENELLYDNKMLLEQQLSGLSSKEERIDNLEEENKKLKSHIHHIAEERQFDQVKVKEVMEENAQLAIDKQESMAELFALNAELEVLRGKSSGGGGPLTLASECNESSSMDVLRLSQQNQHLKKSLEDLRGSSAKLIELERENRTVHEKLLQEKQSVHRLNEDLAKWKAKSKKLSSEIEKLNRTVHALREELHVSSTEVLNLSGELKDRGEVIAELQHVNYKQSSEISEKSEDAVVKEENVATLTNAVVNKDQQLVSLDQKTKQKDVVIAEMTKRVQEKKETIDQMENVIADKDNQLRSLQSRLGESINNQQQSDDTVKKQKKEINELENRVDEISSQNKKTEEQIKRKEKEIAELQKRVEETHTHGNKADEKLRRKEKEIYELKNRLAVASDDNERLTQEVKAKDGKIQLLQNRVDELSKSFEDNTEALSNNLREKEKRNKQLERRIEELNEALEEAGRLKELLAQKEEKINNLSKNYEVKEKQLRELETRFEDSNSESKKLQHTLKLKDKKIDALESSLSEIENSSVVQKDHRIVEIKRTVEVRDNRIAELENRLEDLTSANNKLNLSVKIKDEKIAELETQIDELETLTSEKNRLSQNLDQKMKRIIELENSVEDLTGENQRLQLNSTQKNQKIEALEIKMDEFDDILAENEKLLKSNKHKEEKIIRLQERLDEIEDAVNMNESLNKSLRNRDEKIKALGKRILDLETDAEAKEKEGMKLAQKNYTKIRDLETRLEDVTNVKVQRQNSVKRREDKIVDLETRRTKLEEYVQEKEGKIHDLQSRLDGSVNQFRRLDMTIGEKEMKIAELEAKLIESQEAARENRRLNQIMKTKDARLTQLDEKFGKLETTSSKLQKDTLEKDEMIEGLQKRLEETLNLNNKLDQSVRKKEENIRTLEKTLLANEKREEELEGLLDARTEKLSECKKRVIDFEDAIENKDNEIDDLKKRYDELKNATTAEEKREVAMKEKDDEIRQLSEKLDDLSKVSEHAERLERLNNDKENKLLDTQTRLEESETENRRTNHSLKLKEQKIETLVKRVEELEQTKNDTAQSQSHVIKKSETRISILTQSTKQQEADIFNLETKLDESTVQINKLSRMVEQKEDRISALKSRLEEAVHQNNKVTHALELKDDKIQAMEKRLEEASKQQMQLREELESRTPDREARAGAGRESDRDQRKKGGSSQTIIFRPADNTRNDRKTVEMLAVADKRIADLNDEIRLLEKQNAIVATQNESLSSRNAQLEIENDSLKSEVQMMKNDFGALQSDMKEARDYYHQLDLSAATMGHRCEMLGQLNATLEEENKALHDKVDWLIGQNQTLMVKSLEDKDQFMEEERLFSDKLYNLQRTKEKLEEQIDLANKALAEATPKKKPNFFKKVLQKAGLKKKKDDLKSRNPVHLLRHEQYDELDSTAGSDHHDDSLHSLRVPFATRRFDESSVASRDSSASGDSARGPKSNQSEVLLRRPWETSVTSPVASTSALMSPQEMDVKSRKVSHDVSVFRARQVRSEIFHDNFRPGKLVRPKSLDAIDKLNGSRGSDSGGSAATIEVMPSSGSHHRYGMGHVTPPGTPASGRRAGPRQASSPYTSPVLSRKMEAVRGSAQEQSPAVPSRSRSGSPPEIGEGTPRGHPPPYPGPSTPVREQRSQSSPTPMTPPRSRRDSFSSAVSGNDDSPVSRIEVDGKSPVSREPDTRVTRGPKTLERQGSIGGEPRLDSRRREERRPEVRSPGSRPSSARESGRESRNAKSPQSNGAFIRDTELRVSYSRKSDTGRDRSSSGELIVALAGVSSPHSAPAQQQRDISSSIQGKVATPRVVRDESRLPKGDSRVPRDESRLPRDDARVPRDDARKPREDSRQRDESRLPRDEARLPRDEARLSRDDARIPRDESRVPRDESRHPRDDSRVPRDESRHQRDDARNPRDDSRVPRDESRHARDDSRVPRDEPRHPRNDARNPRDDSRVPRDELRNPRDDVRNTRDDSRVPRDESRYPREDARNPRDDSRLPREEIRKPRDNTRITRDETRIPKDDSRTPRDESRISKDEPRIPREPESRANNSESSMPRSRAVDSPRGRPKHSTPPVPPRRGTPEGNKSSGAEARVPRDSLISEDESEVMIDLTGCDVSAIPVCTPSPISTPSKVQHVSSSRGEDVRRVISPETPKSHLNGPSNSSSRPRTTDETRNSRAEFADENRNDTSHSTKPQPTSDGVDNRSSGVSASAPLTQSNVRARIIAIEHQKATVVSNAPALDQSFAPPESSTPRDDDDKLSVRSGGSSKSSSSRRARRTREREIFIGGPATMSDSSMGSSRGRREAEARDKARGAPRTPQREGENKGNALWYEYGCV